LPEGGMPEKDLISIVDDDKSVREALKGLMKSMGFAAEIFSCAQEFLNSDCLHRTACLIADVQMPGMSGPELHQHLVTSGKPIPTILITAYSDEGVRARVLRAGVICYFAKPFKEHDLLSCICSILGHPAADETGP
jgi:FixJ family two-component response regulator